MTHSPHPDTNSIPHGEKEDEAVGGGFTRRGVLAGAAAATAAVSIGAIDTPASAQTPEEMIVFVQLSAALTGIAAAAWFAERALDWVNPVDPLVESIAAHALWLLAGLVVLTVAATVAENEIYPRRRGQPIGPGQPAVPIPGGWPSPTDAVP